MAACTSESATVTVPWMPLRRDGQAVGEIYLARYFPPSSRAQVTEMTRQLKLSMGRRIQGNSWMTPATRPSALSTDLRGSSTKPIWNESHSERNRCVSWAEKSGLVSAAGPREGPASRRGSSTYSRRC